MATLGIELCSAGFQAAGCEKTDPRLLTPGENAGVLDWPGFAYHDNRKFWFGRSAEDAWFVHPRQVSHAFWDKLSHEASGLDVAGKSPSFSELAFYFLRDFAQRLVAAAGPPEKVVLAVPSAYLKDRATAEQKVGLLLGMAGELRLPLAGIVDMAAAALCDPRASGFNPALSVVVVDVQLHGADLTLHAAEQGRFDRKDFVHLPQAGYASLLKHLTATMGNRFLRHTAFDILEDGHIEQAFYRQTKDFLLSGAAEYRYQINTAKRAYEMIATQEQLAVDAQPFVQNLLPGVRLLSGKGSGAAEPCTVALTARTACLPGLEPRLRAAGLVRLLRLPLGAAACGAAFMGANRLQVRTLDEIPVETAVPLSEVKCAAGAPWEAHLQKARSTNPRLQPTHVIIDGVGHVLDGNGSFTIGAAGASADLALPETFNMAGDCVVQLVRAAGRLWFVDPAPTRAPSAHGGDTPARTAVEAGDRLTIRCGSLAAELLFAHCYSVSGPRA